MMLAPLLFLLLAVDLGRDADGCPDGDTTYGRILIEAGESCPKLDKALKQEAANEKRREAVVSRFATRPIGPALKTSITRKMNLIAIDGPSIRYLWPAQKHPYVYCGFINGKNRLGGYTGWSTFIAELGDAGNVDSIDIGNDSRCEAFGYASSPG